MDFMQKYLLWVNTASEPKILEELNQIANDYAAIENRFYCDLEFGTGGLRGILGAGTNRMNIYTVAKATQGYADYLLANHKSPSVAIAYDSRINSELFSRMAAAVFAANGVRVWLYPKLMPTPALSFAVRDLCCDGGVVVTASHNPAEYNGYKVYGADGCQITSEVAKEIQSAIDKVDTFRDVKKTDFDSALKKGGVLYIGEDTVERYLAEVSSASILPKDTSRHISIVYTPLNGTGVSCVLRCLRENGFADITLVEEQSKPDGRFSTCPYPNPEMPEALEVGLRWAEKTGSELLLATDPDCDRVGTAVKNREGTFSLISGNEMGVLLLDFICRMRIAKGTMPRDPVAIKTIVTTPLAYRIAEHYGVKVIDVLTGFKFIGEQIGLLEKAGEIERFIFGFEESNGYLSGSFVRDKDAVNASLLICEMLAHYKAKGCTLLDVLDELYQVYGYYESQLLSFSFEGSMGFAKMQEIMKRLRNNSPESLGGHAVTHIKDYLQGIDGLPGSNMLRFFLPNECEVVIRPSGTEPKLKVYITATGKSKRESVRMVEELARSVNALVRL